MSMASEVMKLIFAVLDVSFSSGHYTVIIKWQFLYIIWEWEIQHEAENMQVYMRTAILYASGLN